MSIVSLLRHHPLPFAALHTNLYSFANSEIILRPFQEVPTPKTRNQTNREGGGWNLPIDYWFTCVPSSTCGRITALCIDPNDMREYGKAFLLDCDLLKSQ